MSRGFLLVNESKAKMMSIRLNRIEELLNACDMELLKQRRILVQMLKSAETGLEDREHSIKEQLRQMAILEMQKGKDEDEMLDQTLKAIEIVNIGDISSEKDNLEQSCDYLLAKKAELDKQEEELLKEKHKRELKKAAAMPKSKQKQLALLQQQ